MLSKVCTRCGETKPATRDYFGSTPSGGLRGYCRTCMNKASRDYETNNKGRRRARDEKRAQAQGGTRRGADPNIKNRLLKKQNGWCPCCLKPITKIDDAEVDHLVPLAKGGRDEQSNLMLAHATCNREKHNKTLTEHWEWRVKVGLDSENIGRKLGITF